MDIGAVGKVESVIEFHGSLMVDEVELRQG